MFNKKVDTEEVKVEEKPIKYIQIEERDWKILHKSIITLNWKLCLKYGDSREKVQDMFDSVCFHSRCAQDNCTIIANKIKELDNE